MVSWGGLGGLAPPGISVTRALPPGGGLGGLAPQESPLITRALPPQRPCLAPVPCPQFFSSEFFRPNFFVRIFSSECFRQNFFVRIFSSEFFRPSSVRRPSVHPSSVRPSVVRPSVRPSVRPTIRGGGLTIQTRRYVSSVACTRSSPSSAGSQSGFTYSNTATATGSDPT